jgi:hypothetical protein
MRTRRADSNLEQVKYTDSHFIQSIHAKTRMAKFNLPEYARDRKFVANLNETRAHTAMTDALLLYTRSGCHLCEQVVAMLEASETACTPVDIEQDPALELQYGLTIPVLRLTESGRELFFPFNQDQLMQFLEGNE